MQILIGAIGILTIAILGYLTRVLMKEELGIYEFSTAICAVCRHPGGGSHTVAS